MQVNDTFKQTIKGTDRTYSVCEVREMTTATAESFDRRGFEPKFYFAESAPIGRQRKSYCGLFLRNKSTGEMVAA